MTTPLTGTIQLAGGTNITLSQSGNSVSISGQNIGSVSMWPYPIPGIATSVPLTQSTSQGAGGASTQSSQTQWAWVVPMAIEAPVVANNIRMGLSHSMASGATSASGTYQYGGTFALYTRSGSTLNSVSSWTHSLQYSHATNTASSQGTWNFQLAYGGSAGGSTVSSTTSSSANTTFILNPISGSKLSPFNVSSNTFTISAGHYWGLFMQSSQTGGQASHGSMSAVAMLSVSAAAFVSEIGDAVANITTPYPLLGQMSWLQTSNSNAGLTQALAANSSFTRVPASIHVTQVTTTVASANSASVNQVPFIQFITRGD